MFVPGRTAPAESRLRAVDEHLRRAFGELVAHDDRLRGLAVEARFDRGVAHLTGEVADHGQLRLVRDLIGRLHGVLGVWSRVRVAGREPTVLDLGCGGVKQYDGNIGLDLYPTVGVDAVADLSRPLPIADDSVDVIFTVHILEHLLDFLPLVDECHRVLRPGGTLHVLSPWYGHVNAVADPTHVRLLDLQTIKGICRRGPHAPRWYPLHAACDGASIFADLTPLGPDDPAPEPAHLARFFD
ncbi:MAG TPA: methyltransferase domain-containing protein [Micromonosporaceae bacterium]